MHMTITLIGMPGCGKSCMGRSLARRLGLRNIDGDRVIEQRTGRKLQQILDTEGIEAFKRIEEEALLSITGDGLLISTGGSAVYYEAAMQHLRSLGPVIYLYCSLPVLKRRLGDFSKRGVVLRPGQTIDDLYEERCRLYERYADITVDCDGEAYGKYQWRLMRTISYYADGTDSGAGRRRTPHRPRPRAATGRRTAERRAAGTHTHTGQATARNHAKKSEMSGNSKADSD